MGARAIKQDRSYQGQELRIRRKRMTKEAKADKIVKAKAVVADLFIEREKLQAAVANNLQRLQAKLNELQGMESKLKE